MKMPNKFSAPSGRRPTLRMESGGGFANFFGFGKSDDPAAGMYARANQTAATSARAKKTADVVAQQSRQTAAAAAARTQKLAAQAPQRAAIAAAQARGTAQSEAFGGTMPTMQQQQQQDSAVRQSTVNPDYFSQSKNFSSSQRNTQLAVPNGTGNLLRQDQVAAPTPAPVAAPAAPAAPVPTANMQQNRSASPSAPADPAAQSQEAAFRALNPSIYGASAAPAAAPKPSGPIYSAATSGSLRPNSFGDAASSVASPFPSDKRPADGANILNALPMNMGGAPVSTPMESFGGVDGKGGAGAKGPQSSGFNAADWGGAGRPRLRDGGPTSQTMRHTGMGGPVPGKGQGDKTKALYEKGEFVVSNDMLKADPELREQLHALRAQVLADKGMTPAEADAKATGGKTLRANDAYSSRSDMRLPQSRYPTGVTGVNTIEPYPAVAPDPRVMTQGVDGVSQQGQRYPGRAMVAQGQGAQVVDGRGVATTADAGRGFTQGPSNLGRDANTIYQGSNTAGKFDVAARPIDPNVVDVESRVVGAKPGAPMPPNAGPPVAPGGYRTGQKIAAALRAPLGRAVPIIGGGIELAQGIDNGDGWGMAKGAGDMIAGAALATPAAPIAAGYLGLRGLYEGGKAVAGMISDSAMSDRDAKVAAMLGTPAAASTKQSAPAEQDFTASNAAKIAAADAEVKATKLGDVRNVDPEAGTQDVFTQGVWRTVSTPAAKAARALRDEQYEAKQEKDTANSRADLARQSAYFSKAAGTDADSQALRMFDNLGKNHRAAAINQMMQTQATARNSQLQAETSLRTTGMNNETTREGNQMQLEGQRLSAQTARATALRDQANKDREFDQTVQTNDQSRGQKASDQFAKDFSAYDPDGKRNEGLSAARQTAIRKIMPGIDNLTADGRSKHMPEAEILGKVFDRLASSPQMGLDKLIKAKSPGHDELPNLMGATLKQQGWLGGKLTPGGQSNGWYVTMPDNTDVPLGDLSAGEIEVLRRATKTGSWRKQAEK